MEKKKNNWEFLKNIEFWKTGAILFLGMFIGMSYMANDVIDMAIDQTNDCRHELWEEQNPPEERNQPLYLEGFNFTWPDTIG